MPRIDYNLLNRLKNGDFEQLNIDYWFTTHQYYYIEAIIQGCDKVINKDIFNFIVTYAELLLQCPNVNAEHSSEEIIYNCEDILLKAIIVGSKHYDEYRDVVLPLFNSNDETVRLYCHANLNINISWFCHEETSNRIQKVRYIRTEFSRCWDEDLFNCDSKKRISYLVKTLHSGVIQCNYNNLGQEYTPVTISSLLFECDLYIPKFDVDVLQTIQDKRILGYCLNKLIEDGYLKFRSDIRLPIWFTISHDSVNKIRTKRPEAITTFDKMYTIKD